MSVRVRPGAPNIKEGTYSMMGQTVTPVKHYTTEDGYGHYHRYGAICKFEFTIDDDEMIPLEEMMPESLTIGNIVLLGSTHDQSTCETTIECHATVLEWQSFGTTLYYKDDARGDR